jgi:integrating conjugative element protein (TIGR03755 family)
MQNYFRPVLRTSVFVCALFAAFPSFAAELLRPSADGRDWFFTMGGADPYVTYRQSNRTTLDFDVGAEWSAFRGCSFDPRLNVINTLRDAEEGLYGFARDVAETAPTLVATWGLSLLQSNYPGAYDLLTKGLVDAKNSFSASVKTCRDMKDDLASGRDPSNGWVRFSKKGEWEASASTGRNPVKTAKTIDNAGDRGVTWIGGEKRAGRNMPPINTVGDTVEAAFEHVNNPSSPDSGTGERITRVFPTSTDAARWTATVVGESTIRTCNNCKRLVTKMGQGLRNKHAEERKSVDIALGRAMTANKITKAHLDALSAPGMGIVATEDIIRGLREAPASEQAILANRFASELALARVTEKALIARDLLNIGMQEPNISANDLAVDQLDRARDTMDRELNNIIYEQDVRSKVLSKSSQVLSERTLERDTSARSNQLQAPVVKPDTLIDGAIPSNE